MGSEARQRKSIPPDSFEVAEFLMKMPVRDVVNLLHKIPWLMIVEVDHDQVKAVLIGGSPVKLSDVVGMLKSVADSSASNSSIATKSHTTPSHAADAESSYSRRNSSSRSTTCAMKLSKQSNTAYEKSRLSLG